MFPDTRESTTAGVHSVIICLLLITSHFRLSTKRSVKFFYLAPICSVHTGLGSLLCSITPVKEPAAFLKFESMSSPIREIHHSVSDPLYPSTACLFWHQHR